MANAYGLKYSYIANNKELRNKLKKILNNNIAEIIEVKIDPNKHLYPKLTSQIGTDGKMSTSPLEDLYPFISRDELKEIMISKK